MFITTQWISIHPLSSLSSPPPSPHHHQPKKRSKITHLKVPTPPASKIKLGFDLTSTPTHRAANALKIWPCATISTSFGPVPFFPFHPASFPNFSGPCHFARISFISASNRAVMSAGDSPPSQPSRQMSQLGSRPRFARLSRIWEEVKPS